MSPIEAASEKDHAKAILSAVVANDLARVERESILKGNTTTARLGRHRADPAVCFSLAFGNVPARIDRILVRQLQRFGDLPELTLTLLKAATGGREP